MRRVVVDASIVLGWFTTTSGPARALRTEYERGMLSVVAPLSLPLDLLEAAARITAWPAKRLDAIAIELRRLRLELRDPPTPDLTTWLARGLGGTHASYAALASSLDVPLVTLDEELLVAAAVVAQRP